jgi:hypothetical protein
MEDLGLVHQLTLVSEIVSVIERYNGDHGIVARPDELCDTMLTVAGLLHSEAAALGHSSDKPLEDSFVERALECMAKIKWASSSEAPGLLQ